MTKLLDAALALGAPVFPCNAEKHPITPRGFKDASADPDAIARMFDTASAALIGMPTGDVTGIFAVDVDMGQGKRGGEWLESAAHLLPQTYTVRTRSGGRHLYFAMPSGLDLRNSASKIAPDVDIRANGGYVITPPSEGYEVIDHSEAAEAPQWLLDALKPPAPISPPITPYSRVLAEGATAYGRAALERACDAIRSAPFGAQEATLNGECFSIAQLVSGGELAEGEAVNALLSAARCMPSEPGKSPWYPSQLENKVRRAFQSGKSTARTAPAPEPEPVHPAQGLIDKIRQKSAQRQAQPLPVEQSLLDVDGALKLFIDYVESTAISPQPFLALAAGICALGAVAGRRYRTATNLRTNIYAIGVADSGGGKDHARKCLKRVLVEAELTQYLGGEDIASGTAMLTALQRHPAMLFQIDEFGDWLRQVLSERAPTHKAQIAQRLKTLYSAAGDWVSGTEYADQKASTGKPREDIFEPHACFYGTTTPGQLWGALSGSGAMEDGLLARFLVFVSPVSYPDPRDAIPIDPPEPLVRAFQAVAHGAGGEGNLSGLMAPGIRPSPFTVPMTHEAEVAAKALRDEQVKQARKGEGTGANSILARWTENSIKLALIRAVSRNPGNPIINETDIAWGRAVAEHAMRTIMREIDANAAESPFEKLTKKIMKLARRRGSITKRDMNHGGITVPPRDLQAALDTLVEAGQLAVRARDHGGAGRPCLEWVATASWRELIDEELATIDDDET